MSRSDPPAAETVSVVLVTAPDAQTGSRLAREVVEARLAACVNLVAPVRSIYRWQGEVREDAEVLLVIKTGSGRCAELAQRIREIHPYDLPEVLALPASGGSPEYLDWVRQESSR